MAEPAPLQPAPAEPVVCAAHDIGVTFRQPTLRHVSLSCGAGGWLGIIGPNGAGKTTLLRVLAGLVRPDQGHASIAEQDVGRLSPRSRARQIAYIPQSPSIPPGMKVLDYVLLGRTAHFGAGFNPSPKDLAIAHDTLARLDAAGFADVPVEQISGGERQRVIIARALAQRSRLLLMDEPTSALDLGQQLEVLELLDRLRSQRGLAVITAMHDLSLAGQFTDELLLLSDGKTAAQGTPREVLTQENIRLYYGAEVDVVFGDFGVALNVRRQSHAGAAG